MTHCEKCIHHDVCEFDVNVMPEDLIPDFPHNEGCAQFKPAADVVEIRHGTWIKKEDGHYVCSECGRTRPYSSYNYVIQNWACNYCHWCGAKMEGKESENEQ